MFIRVRSRLLGVAATSLVAVMALAACGGTTGKSNSDLLKEAGANMKSVKTYHLVADIDQAGQAVKLDGDFDVPNKAIKLNIESGGQKVAMIQVGDKVYLSTDGGTNYVDAGASGAAITESFGQFTGMWDTFKPEDVDKAKDALKDGTPATEKIDGVDTKHITADAKQLSLLSPSGSTSTATEGTLDLWLGPEAKPYVRQMKLDTTSNGQPMKGTLTWSKIDEPVDIKAPNQ